MRNGIAKFVFWAILLVGFIYASELMAGQLLKAVEEIPYEGRGIIALNFIIVFFSGMAVLAYKAIDSLRVKKE